MPSRSRATNALIIRSASYLVRLYLRSGMIAGSTGTAAATSSSAHPAAPAAGEWSCREGASPGIEAPPAVVTGPAPSPQWWHRPKCLPACCGPLNSQCKSGQHPVRTSGPALRSPRQQPRTSQPSVGQDTGGDYCSADEASRGKMAQIKWQRCHRPAQRSCHPIRATACQRPAHGSDLMAQDNRSGVRSR